VKEGNTFSSKLNERHKGTKMQKLIDRYRSEPTEKNALKLKAYYIKHPFAGCLLSIEDQALVAKLVY
jgi:hypothetical protein